MAGASGRNHWSLASLAPAAPRVMIGTNMRRVAKIDVGSLRLGHLPDLRVGRLEPLAHQRLIPLDRPVQWLLRGNAELGQQPPH